MITYTGNTEIEEKIKNIIKEMKDDKELNYTLQVYESRENDKISKFMFEVINIQNFFKEEL